MVNLKNVDYIVTHGGGVHEDDFLSVCLALHLIGGRGVVNGRVTYVPVYRRDPTTPEIEDPDVLVLDVGRVHCPETLAFDHHQRDDDSVVGQCAFSLFVQAVGLGTVFSVQRWFDAFVLNDAAGPFAVAADLDLPRYPFELESPIAFALLLQFEQEEVYAEDAPLLNTMAAIGEQVLKTATEFSSRYYEILTHGARVSSCSVDGVMLTEKLSETDLYSVAQALKDGGQWGFAQFIMFHSTRGKGWDFFRFNDSTEVDYSVLDGAEGVDFAHPVGFFCQLTERLPDLAALAATEAAYTKR